MNDKPLNQKGMTLVELLIAIAVAGLVVAVVAAIMFQLFGVSDRTSDHVVSYNQVQNAGYWISHDAVQAQEVDDTSGLVTLDWVDWDGNAHQVIYTLQDASDGLKQLRRSYYTKDSGQTDFEHQNTIVVAQYIDSSTTCDWDEDERVLTLVVTAQVGDQTATRTYKVEPRPLS